MKLYWKLLALASFILGVLTLYPWDVTKPNFLGYYSICSFAPVSAFGMFVIATALYSWKAKYRKLFYGTLGVLVVVLGFVGFWLMTAKLPMENIQTSMSFYYYWSGYTEVYDKNGTTVSFNLYLYNPSDHDTLGFRVESPKVLINNWLLPYYCVDCWNGSSAVLYRYMEWLGPNSPLIIKANQTVTLQIAIHVLYDEVPDDIWASLQNRNFTVTMSALLTVRPFLDESDILSSLEAGTGKIIWVAKPFSVLSTYKQ